MRGARLVFVGLLGAYGVCEPMGHDAHARTLLGIHLGEPLERQFAPCPAGDSRWTTADKPCWRRASGDARTVALPRALQAVAATFEVRRVTEDDGRVVEVELEFRPEDAARVERHLRSGLGNPAEVDVYERHSRVRGLSKHRSVSWKSGGMTVNLLEIAASGNGSVRAFLDRWAEAEAAREREKREKDAKALDEKSRSLRERLSSPLAALDRALSARDAAEVKALLAQRMDLAAATPQGNTVLHTAAAVWGDVDILRQLVDAGAPVDALDDEGRTPLHAALASPHYLGGDSARARLMAVFDFFMNRRADVHAKDRQGRTPITATLRTRDMMPVVDHMLDRGLPLPADGLLAALQGGAVDDDFRRHPALLDKVGREHVLARDSLGRTAMHLAAQSAKTIELLRVLQASGADVEARSRFGWTAFVEACSSGNVAAMEWLAKQGANVRVKTDDGSTALHIVAPDARGAQIRWLVERGIDPAARNDAGQRALDIALESGRFAARSDAEKLDVVTLLGGSARDMPPRRR